MPVIHKALGLIYSNMRKKISNLQPGPEAHTPVILLLEPDNHRFKTSFSYMHLRLAWATEILS